MSAIVLDANDRKELLVRFLRYVQVDTQSDENSTSSPSTEKQKDLSKLLADELRALGRGRCTRRRVGLRLGFHPGQPPRRRIRPPPRYRRLA